MSIRHCVAVDLGASSGRVMLASYQSGPRALTLREIHRFTNSLQKVDGFDCWDLDSLEGEIRRGLEKVCEQGILIDSIGTVSYTHLPRVRRHRPGAGDCRNRYSAAPWLGEGRRQPAGRSALNPLAAAV